MASMQVMELGLLSQTEAAKRLNLTRQRVRQLIDEGALIAVTVAGRPLVVESSLQHLIQKRNSL